MKLTVSSIGFVMVFAFAGNAAADTPVKLQLSIQPAANDAELDKLMRQNTVRVALQRHRLWQEAADRELDREAEAEQLREEKQTREQKKVRTKSRKRTKTAATPVVPKTGDDVAIEGAEGAKDGDGEQNRYRHQNRKGEEGDRGEAAGVADRTRLRDMLRKERVSGGDDALEEKLQQRLREHKRQTDRVKSGKQNQHKKGGSGTGSGSGSRKRSGR